MIGTLRHPQVAILLMALYGRLPIQRPACWRLPLKRSYGLPYPTTLRPAGDLQWNGLSGVATQSEQLAAVLLPFWISHAVQACPSSPPSQLASLSQLDLPLNLTLSSFNSNPSPHPTPNSTTSLLYFVYVCENSQFMTFSHFVFVGCY
jgi:hypothetical protein